MPATFCRFTNPTASSALQNSFLLTAWGMPSTFHWPLGQLQFFGRDLPRQFRPGPDGAGATAEGFQKRDEVSGQPKRRQAVQQLHALPAPLGVRNRGRERGSPRLLHCLGQEGLTQREGAVGIQRQKIKNPARRGPCALPKFSWRRGNRDWRDQQGASTHALLAPADAHETSASVNVALRSTKG